MRSPEAVPAPAPSQEEGKQGKIEDKKRHLKIVTEEDEPIELTEADMLPTMVEEAEAHMAKERSVKEKENIEMGVAKALGREQRAIREAQAQLASEAVDELVAEQEAEEREKASSFGEEKVMKAPAKEATLMDRIKGWFRGKK